MKYIIGPAFSALGGVEVIAKNQLIGLRNKGHDVKIIVSESSYDTLSNRYSYDEINADFLFVPNNDSVVKYLHYIFSKIIKRGDVIITYNTQLSSYFAIISIFLGVKVIAYEHFNFNNISRLWSIIRKMSYRFLSTIVILNNSDIGKYKSLNKNIKVIANYSLLMDAKKSISMKRPNKFAFIGHVTDTKNVYLLLNAINGIKESLLGKNFFLSIYGNGEELERCRSYVEFNKLQSLIEFKGFTNNTDNVYEDVQYIILPSKTECQPLVIIDALRKGVIPVVSYYSDAVTELVQDDETGILIGEANLGNIQTALLKATDLPINNRIYMQGNAIKHSRFFSLKENIRQWDELLKKI